MPIAFEFQQDLFSILTNCQTYFRPNFPCLCTSIVCNINRTEKWGKKYTNRNYNGARTIYIFLFAFYVMRFQTMQILDPYGMALNLWKSLL